MIYHTREEYECRLWDIRCMDCGVNRVATQEQLEKEGWQLMRHGLTSRERCPKCKEAQAATMDWADRQGITSSDLHFGY